MNPLRFAASTGLAFLLMLVRPGPVPLPAQQPTLKAARAGAEGDRLPPRSLARLGTLRFRQGSAILAVALAPDGRTAASAGRDGKVRLWEVPTGRELRRFAVGPTHAMGLAFSPDGKSLAATGGNNKVRLWDVASGRLMREFPKGWGPVAFSRDGRNLVAAFGGDGVYVWDVATGKELLRASRHCRSVVAIAFSADDRVVLSAGGYEDRAIHFHEVASGKARGKFVEHQNNVQAFALSPDGRALAIAGYFPALQLRDAVTGAVIRTLDGGKTWCRSVAFTPDGRGVVSGADDGAVCLWDTASGKELRRFDGLRGAVNGVALSADGKVLVAGGADRVLRAWDVASGKALGPTGGHAHRVTALHVSADGRTLTSAARDRTVRTWDVASYKELRRRDGPADWLGRAAFAPDGSLLACPCSGGLVRLWETATGREVCRFKVRLPEITPLVFAPDGKRLSALGQEGEVVVWDTRTGKPLQRLVRPSSHFVGGAWSPDGRFLAAGCSSPAHLTMRMQTYDRIVLYDMDTGKSLRALVAPLESNGVPMIFAPDGRTFASREERREEVRLWEAASGKVRRTFAFRTPPERLEWSSPYEAEDQVSALAMSPDGRLLALGLDQRVYVWDTLMGAEVGRFAGHEGKVAALAFAPDGKTLASAGDDTTIVLWDVAALPDRRPAEGTIAAAALEALWAELGRDTAADAMARLVGARAQAAALLRAKLRPVPVPPPGQLARLFAALESARFNEREAATRQLADFAELIEPDLRRRLEGKPPEEVRRRLERLLDRLRTDAAEQLRPARAVEVLERIGSPAARAILQTLARGAAPARLTREAKASLTRLDKRPGRPTAPPSVDAHGDPLPAGALARLGTVRLRHVGQVAYLALSPDSTLLAAGNYFPQAAVQVSKTATGKRVLYKPVPDAFNVMAMAFTPDAKILALAGQGISNDYACVYLWDVASGKELHRFPMPVNHASFHWLAAFTPDGKTLAAGCDKIYLLDTATGALRHTLTTGKNHTTALAFAPDGGLLATAGDDGSLCLWDPRTGKQLTALKTDLAYTLAFGPDSKVLAGAGPGRPVRLWQVTRGPGAGAARLTLLDPPEGHEGGGTALAFAKDGRLLAAGGFKGEAWIWDTAARKRVRVHPWAEVHAQAAGFDAAGRALVVGTGPNGNGGVRILDASAGRELLAGAGHHGAIHRLAFSPDGKTLASLGQAGTLRLWQSPGGKQLGGLDLPGGDVDEATFTASGKLLACVGGTLYRIDVPTGKPVRLPLAVPKAFGHTLSPDGSRMAVRQVVRLPGKAKEVLNPYLYGEVSFLISLWDVATGKELCKLPVLKAAQVDCTFAPDGRVLATVAHELTLWDATTGRLLHRLPVAAPLVRAVGFGPRGRVLAVRELDAISLWEVASGQRIRSWSLPPEERPKVNHSFERGIAFSSDGRLLAADTFHGAIHFWDVGTGQLVHTLAGQGSPIAELAFAPDGKVLAAGNADGSVLLWDVTGVRPLSAAALKPLTAADYGKLWEQLADARASAAYPALATLAAAGEPAAAWLRGRLKPAAPIDVQRLTQLIRDLHDSRFPTREKAMSELEGLGEPAAEALRQALLKPLPLEGKRRADQVLQKLNRRAPEALRALRAVDVLERIGTPEARAILRALAGGAPAARLTQEARASLKRLDRD